jgi:hypothetical protein
LNKAEPSDNDNRPGELFNQFLKKTQINQQQKEYVDVEDMPIILFKIFAG